MTNERTTENMVRRHFGNDKKVIIEEQGSKNDKINKLLKNASKSGPGKGFPDFIIQYNNDPDLIIVIECKGDINKHESPNKKQYKDYAVDGVLLYTSFLSKEYDVIAIAVSGDDNNHKISHFLQLKGTQKSHDVFNNKLLSSKDYLDGYKKDERKFKQDFQKLLSYSKCLNDYLHSLKVKESERSLLISGILIALKDKAFKSGYKLSNNPKTLAHTLVTTIEQELSSVQTSHIKGIISSYDFIKTHALLSKKQGILIKVIDEIDKEINNFTKNHKYFDTLGQFYIEFLRHANNDKGLGIVLTPSHITELFCEIADINEDSIILDTCTGTGGFLISAMQKMVECAGGNTKKEKRIKENQIVGIEFQHDIYSLLCSNMYIRGDGRSNLMKGDCFENNIKNEVAKFKPDVGFLNPPYKNAKDDKDELEFVLNNLEQLKKNSYCVAIIPMSCMIATNGIRLVLKEKILKNHTLEAVFSMPDELFKNSNVAVVTCIVVLKSGVPHPNDFAPYFAYCKDDGFYNKKTSGRADYDDRWNEIKKEWIKNYRNRYITRGRSITKKITADKEWCSEAYLETDYSSLLTEDVFKDAIFNFVVFRFKNKLITQANKESITKTSRIKLSDIKNSCEYFDLSKLFDIEGSSRYTKREIEEYGKGNYPYIGTSSENNGVKGFYDHHTEKENVLTIDSATIGSCFYQPIKFSASDHVEILTPKFKMNIYHALFIQAVINIEQFRYGYGRKFSQKRIKNTKIKLPVNSENKDEPDWNIIEDYIKSLPYSINLK